ncbi:MAG: hypothetical protein K9L86_00130 [Candidatus Omnitrophica bacterium]|nr:hypothetical protein [Candidatus Omnitrophota bacterium]
MIGRRKISKVFVSLAILIFLGSLSLSNLVYAGCDGACPVNSAKQRSIQPAFANTAQVKVGQTNPKPSQPAARSVKIKGPTKPNFKTNKASSGEKYQVKKGELVSGNNKVVVKDRISGDQRGKISSISNIGGKDYALTEKNKKQWSIKYNPITDKTTLTYKYKSTDEYIADWAAKNLEGYNKKAGLGKAVAKVTSGYEEDLGGISKSFTKLPDSDSAPGGDPFKLELSTKMKAEGLSSLLGLDNLNKFSEDKLKEVVSGAFAIVATTEMDPFSEDKFIEKIDFFQGRAGGLARVRDDAEYKVTIWGRDSKSSNFGSITDQMSGKQLRSLINKYWIKN